MAVTRKNRETGTMITVTTGKEEGLDGKWLTICEEHANIVSHDTKRLAMWHAPNPSGWCEGCRNMIYPEHEELHTNEAHSSGGIKHG